MGLVTTLRLAAQSGSGQKVFRWIVAGHMCLLLVTAAWLRTNLNAMLLLGSQALLTAGIVEGAILIGWPLTQVPKARNLELLFVTKLSCWSIFFGEFLVGSSRLILVHVAALPLLIHPLILNSIGWDGLMLVLVLPIAVGVLTGLAIVVWAYEKPVIRRWLERLLICAILTYLVIGVLACERLPAWLAAISPEFADRTLRAMWIAHGHNPFTILQVWSGLGTPAIVDRLQLVGLTLAVLVFLLLYRAATRLKAHFEDLHFGPRFRSRFSADNGMGDSPLSVWAVRRVTRYSGKINVWLAVGFAACYALYLVAGQSWPPWLGTKVFQSLNHLGGVPVCISLLVQMSAIPAAFQYGLWDSNPVDRRRRLELLLLTELQGRDYWQAASAAAWWRGRGYFLAAAILAGAAGIQSVDSMLASIVALAVGLICWALYFVLGFWALGRGMNAGKPGLILTIGLPALTIGCYRGGFDWLGAWLPPGLIYSAAASHHAHIVFVAALISSAGIVILGRRWREKFVDSLRTWPNGLAGISPDLR